MKTSKYLQVVAMLLCLLVSQVQSGAAGDKKKAVLSGESIDDDALKKIIAEAINAKDQATLRIAATSKSAHTRISALEMIDDSGLNVRIPFLIALLKGGETWKNLSNVGGENAVGYEREVELIVLALGRIGVAADSEKLSQRSYRSGIISSLEKQIRAGKD